MSADHVLILNVYLPPTILFYFVCVKTNLIYFYLTETIINNRKISKKQIGAAPKPTPEKDNQGALAGIRAVPVPAVAVGPSLILVEVLGRVVVPR